ncbi:uncharacterized protein LOC134671005 [Cydia fagiglandana]|uniref:uncharacterized protein LOC134671005 n=1 Tax=Cydia fagiglandana TaxID=1458189 RepID=UPI002FEDF212
MKIQILCTVIILVICSNEAFNNHENEKEVTIPIKDLNKVLLCLEPDDQLTKLTKSSVNHTDLLWKLIDEHPKLNIEYSRVHSCEVKIDAEYPKTILAVVAPKPLETSSRIPMYFFDTPFPNAEDVDEFPNGLFPLRRHWKSLKYAFSHYLTTHGYRRLVVVSDDSYYSAAFEAELIEHFKDKEFVFDVQRKPNKGSFDRAMRYIKDNKAYIIIVNIDNANAQKLLQAAEKRRLLSNRYLWLVRDWPFDNLKRKFKLMISMTLSPYPIPDYKAKYAHDGPNLNSVSRGLALISDALQSVTNVTVKERIDYYYNEIYKEMNRSDKTDLSKAYIRKFISGQLVGMKNIIIHDSGRIESPYQKDRELTGKDFSDFDLPEPCFQRSMAFSSPCNDTNIVIICVVWLMFIVMAILLIFFFNRCLVWT